MRSLPVAAFVVAHLLAPVVAHAGDRQKAKEHFERGQALFKVEKFSDSLAEFEAAYVETPDALFLYNIAQCHRKLGHPQDAARFFRKYLAEFRAQNGKPPKNEASVSALIAELEAARPPSEPSSASPAAAPPHPAPVSPAAPESTPPQAVPAPAPGYYPAEPQAPAPAWPQPGVATLPPPVVYPYPPAPAPAAPAATSSQRGGAGAPQVGYRVFAGAGYERWNEKVDALDGLAGSYETSVGGPSVAAGGVLAVKFDRVFLGADLTYRFFHARGDDDPLTRVNAHQVDAGGRIGFHTAHVDVFGRLGTAYSSMAVESPDDSLPSERLGGVSAGGGVEVHDLGRVQLWAMGALGLSGDRLQDSNKDVDVTDGESQTTTWSEAQAGVSVRVTGGVHAFVNARARMVTSEFDGLSDRLGRDLTTDRDSLFAGAVLGVMLTGP